MKNGKLAQKNSKKIKAKNKIETGNSLSKYGNGHKISRFRGKEILLHNGTKFRIKNCEIESENIEK